MSDERPDAHLFQLVRATRRLRRHLGPKRGNTKYTPHSEGNAGAPFLRVGPCFGPIRPVT
jgi:hypothetical protein